MFAVKEVVTATDFSEPALKGVKTAAEIAENFGASLILVHVLPILTSVSGAVTVANYHLPTLEKEMAAETSELAEKLLKEEVFQAVKSQYRIVHGGPAEKIAKTAEEEDVDLIVIASHGESGWKKFLTGSVAERLIRHAECPVLTVTQG